MLSNIEQQNIIVDVDFYNDQEKETLLQYPTSNQIKEIVDAPIEVPVSEFLTYYLFHKKRSTKLGWQNYREIHFKIYKALSELEDFVVFNGHSIATSPDVDRQVKNITENIGESIGLSVVNKIHGLTGADWGRIPEKGGRRAPKVFDYQHAQAASDGKMIIQIETKGSSVNNNLAKENKISNHKSNIGKKKLKIREQLTSNTYPYPADVMYGTIAALDRRRGSVAKCWLVDPEPEGQNIEPQTLRLINRVRFLYDWISFLSPRSQLASALATRLSALEILENPFALDRLQLKKGNGDNFDYETYDQFGAHSAWMANRSKVTDGPAGGAIFKLSKDALFFLGIREKLLTLSAEQKFEDILEYKEVAGTLAKTIGCVVSKGRYKRLYLPDRIASDAEERGGYYHFNMKGQIHYSPDGIVFGVLPFEQ